MTKKELDRENRREHMRDALAHLKEYIDIYPRQVGWQDYTDEIFIDDILYGLGIALDKDKYQFADGYRKFKERLRSHMDATDRGETIRIVSKPT